MTPLILLGAGGNYADIIDTIEDLRALLSSRAPAVRTRVACRTG